MDRNIQPQHLPKGHFSDIEVEETKFIGLASSHSWGWGERYGCDKAEPYVLLSLIVKIYQIFSVLNKVWVIKNKNNFRKT